MLTAAIFKEYEVAIYFSPSGWACPRNQGDGYAGTKAVAAVASV